MSIASNKHVYAVDGETHPAQLVLALHDFEEPLCSFDVVNAVALKRAKDHEQFLLLRAAGCQGEPSEFTQDYMATEGMFVSLADKSNELVWINQGKALITKVFPELRISVHLGRHLTTTFALRNEAGEVVGLIHMDFNVATVSRNKELIRKGLDIVPMAFSTHYAFESKFSGLARLNVWAMEMKRMDVKFTRSFELDVNVTSNIGLDRANRPMFVTENVGEIAKGAQFHPEFAPKVFNPDTGFVHTAQLFEAFMRSSAKVMILYGPPGTGKTTLIRSMLGMCSTEKSDVKALLCQGETVVNSPHFVAALRSSGSDFAIIEDAELIIRPRSAGNTAMAELLNWIDGVAQSNTKVIITTNLREVSSETVDEALLRPGRCFARVHLGDMSAQEAARARSVVKLPPASLQEGKRYTLAEAMSMPHANDINHQQPVLLLG